MREPRWQSQQHIKVQNLVSGEYEYKRISDAVHGTIGLSRVEAAVIDTAAFQRLHDVKQLGMAYLVYPGANYSRFSHCVGVCHVVGRLITAILSRDGHVLTDRDRRDIQLYRLAGLLHDIGHYPFSHALEHAVENHYKEQYLVSDGDAPQTATNTPKAPYAHETLGGALLEKDEQLRLAIESTKVFSAHEIADIFNPKGTGKYRNVVSSDLDADRIDYLLRTAKHTGLPYGNIDLEYIESQICMDANDRVAFTPNAVRAVDQFLTSRFFDYRQVAYHKTTAGMEWLLQDVVGALLRIEPEFELTRDAVDLRIASGRWKRLTDAYIVEMIERHLDRARFIGPLRDGDKRFAYEESLKAEALLNRTPPTLVASVERFQVQRTVGEPNLHRLTIKAVQEAIPSLAKRFNIPADRWHVWRTRVSLTKVGSRTTMAAAYEGETPNNKYTETVRITPRRGGKRKESSGILDVPQSLTSLLGAYDFRMIRVFVMLERESKDRLRSEIFERLATDLQDAGWTYPRRVAGTEDDDLAGEEGEVQDDFIPIERDDELDERELDHATLLVEVVDDTSMPIAKNAPARATAPSKAAGAKKATSARRQKKATATRKKR